MRQVSVRRVTGTRGQGNAVGHISAEPEGGLVQQWLTCGTAMALVLGAGSTAWSGDYDFTIDPLSSALTVTVEVLGVSDADSSPAAGTILARLTPDTGPFNQIHILTMDATLTETINIDISFGVFLGGVTGTGTGVGALLGNGYGVVGDPTTVDGLGNFNQTGNQIQPKGIINYAGYGLLGGGIGSGTLDALTQPPTAADLTGTVVDDGTTVTLSAPLSYVAAFQVSGIDVLVTVSGTIVAKAPTLPALCPGDTNCDGVVNFKDIDPFVAALGGPANWPDPDCPWLNADTNGDGNVTFKDIDPFVALLGSTCP